MPGDSEPDSDIDDEPVRAVARHCQPYLNIGTHRARARVGRGMLLP